VVPPSAVRSRDLQDVAFWAYRTEQRGRCAVLTRFIARKSVKTVGIEYQDMRSILTALKKELPAGRDSLLILGDAYIHFTPESYVDLAKDVGVELASVPHTLNPFTLGQSLGFSVVETLDINEKASLKIDLQQEIPADLLGTFDCLIDAGVLFWCYDPGAALRNIFKLVKDQGLIIHITAVSGHYGRGYYNIHPLLFEDFYLTNHCQYVHSSYRAKPARRGIVDRIKSILGSRREDLVSYSSRPGNVYLNESMATHVSFGSIPKSPECNMIPNNVVGTFVFKKLASSEPKGPIRLC
jgi:hypothetical protein